ncbi:hypothetical protein K461DRAFT_279398 [Myriangium duriaei CBS 260.36]|uniref:Cep57 centrosome microtubule-binding domain-containing protein n=1 Tax=Myriangium duriaei CBS 260.36 TaxID=1168546 RepID=A0A9P4IXT9_9PEZI|nr:hypothetical protein K461DRAFT_279398 [Myriangium duriaei CBS 260.36]
MAPAREASGVIAQLTGAQYRSKRSAAPSPRFPGHFDGNDSTVNTFQPDHESTQQFDTAADEQSVMSRDSLEHEGLDSQHSDSQSIEIGRGVKRSTRGTSSRHAYGNDFSEEQLLDLGDDSLYNLTATPPARTSQAHKSGDLRKQASVRRATIDRDAEVTKTSDIVPSKTRNNKASGRRTLSDMHAKINAISDSSFILPDPQTHNTATRNSRFAKSRLSSTNNDLPTRFVAGAGLGRASEQTPRRAVSAPVDASLIANQTAQSFMLPDLPNIAELVSGVRKDGTPVFSRTTKPRSRFTSASYARGTNPDLTAHAQIQSIALPEEEKAIFTSLQLLREKVAQLEMEKSEAVKKAEEGENEVLALKSQVQMERRLRRPDSGLGSDEEQRSSEQWRLERGQLQASLKTAQDRLERSDRKHSVADIAVKRIVQERDSLITQLGVAFYSNEELKEENAQLQKGHEILEEEKATLEDEIQILREANYELNAQLEQSEKQHDSDLRQWALREAELKSRVKRNSNRNDEQRSAPTEKDESRRRSSKSEKQDVQSRILERVEHEVRKARAEAVRQSKGTTKSSRNELAKSKSRSRSRPREASATSESRIRDVSAHAHRDRWLDEQTDSGQLSEPATRTRPRATDARAAFATELDDDSKDITYLSFLDPAELAALRKKLEAERLGSKQRPAVDAGTDGKARGQTMPRKSSLKDITSGLDLTSKTSATARSKEATNRAVRVQSPATADAISYSTPEDVGDMSILSSVSRRPQRTKSFEEMTSAFLLPDITVRNSVTSKPQHSEGYTAGAEHAPSTIPKPIPVSERDIDSTFATVRPAQNPQDALASVVAQLQEEIKHLKAELGKTEKDYEGCDPALGKRKRIALKTRMEGLVREIEKRSEQVYALYDVLEGQKDSEQFEVEETLQSLGIDLEEVKKRAGARTSKHHSEDDVESVDISTVSY